MSSHLRRTRPGPYALAVAGAALAVGLALLAPGSWSQPADADDGELGARIIMPFAGTGDRGFSGDGGPATDAELALPQDAAVDSEGNVYIPDMSNHRIRKVDAAGTITTAAGTGGRGFSGDGGPATDAELNSPFGVAVDSKDNLYIADARNNRVRKVDTDGIITTVAGTGSRGFSGDGGPATEADLFFPTNVTVDADDNLYIPDARNSRVRKVDTDGIITTVAGTAESGYNGDDQPATDAELNVPIGVAVEDGDLFIADTFNHRIRKVDAAGTITTVAGTGESEFSGDGGPATDAKLDTPLDVDVAADGTIYIADTENERVRKVDPDGTIVTDAGGGSPDDGVGDFRQPTRAQMVPRGVALDEDLGLLIAERHRVRQVDHVPDRIATDLARSPELARVGEELTYSIHVANPGLAGEATGVEVTFPLDGLELVSADPTQGSCTSDDATLLCDVGTLAEGETAPVSVTVTPTDARIRTDEVTVTVDGDDPRPQNNSASVITLVADARCGEVLTEDTTLADDVGPCPNEGLIVGADGITVDLNGHTVTGWRGYDGFGWPEYNEQRRFPMEPVLETLNNGDAPGVVLPFRQGATVENGTVTGFDAGVVIALGDGGHTVQDLELRQNIAHHPRRQGPFGEGLVVFNSPGNVIADNTLVENGWFDGIGVFGPASDDTEITGNTIRDHPFPDIGAMFNTGIFVNGGDGAGGHTTGMQIANNTVRDNAGHGIVSRNNFDATIANNVVERHGAGGNAGRGIGVSVGDHLADADVGNTVIGNEVRGNDKTGIKIDARGNKIVNNTSTDNSQLRDHWFDLWDAVGDDCEFNKWNNNKWGSAGFTPDCTSTRGLGPGQNPAAGADPDRPEEREMPPRSAPSFDDIGQ